VQYLLQALNYTLFMIVVWYFSVYPPYRQLRDDQAVITLAFGHAGQLLKECHRLSMEELAKLPPNMRKLEDCPRERSHITVELYLDGTLVDREVHKAPGLYSDQGIDVYRSFKVTAGDHQLYVWMNDNSNIEGPTYQYAGQVSLRPEQRAVVEFNNDTGTFAVN